MYAFLFKNLKKILHRIQVFKETIFCCVRFYKENDTMFVIFHIRYVFFSKSYFSSEKEQGKY